MEIFLVVEVAIELRAPYFSNAIVLSVFQNKTLSYPVVAIGVIKWIELIILDQSYFKLNTDGSPIHLIILDDIVQNHSLLHERVLGLLTRLFMTNFADLDNLVQVYECYLAKFTFEDMNFSFKTFCSLRFNLERL